MPVYQDITGTTVLFGCYLQRFSASLGLNSTPTTVEMTLIPGSTGEPYDVARGATGFTTSLARPGTVSGFAFGSFKFMGIVQSWTENYGPQGLTYDVRLGDPRIMLGNVPMILDGSGPPNQVIPNLLNPLNYYGNPTAADLTHLGMTWAKIKDFLVSQSGAINCYGKQFTCSFDVGFSTGNTSGIPPWYRIPGGAVSVDECLQAVAKDAGLDYYVDIDYNSYNPASAYNVLNIKSINRNYSSGIAIDTIISDHLASGDRVSYKRGQELRTDPNYAAVMCAPLVRWYTPTASQIYGVWGRDSNGSFVVNPYNSSGIVLLDNIFGSGVSTALAGRTVSYTAVTLTQASGDNVYPPRISRSTNTRTVTGYMASTNCLRAALYNQDSWECAVFKESSGFAMSIGILLSPFLEENEFLSLPPDERHQAPLMAPGLDVDDRDPRTQNLINAVYNATRTAAESFYGKQFYCDLPTSTILFSGTYDHSELYPEIEYVIADAGNAELIAYPTGLTNHEITRQTSNQIFKDDLGRLRPFVSINNYDSPNNCVSRPIDLKNLAPNQYIIEQGNRLSIPISVQQYEKNPVAAIFELQTPIEGIPSGTCPGYISDAVIQFEDFLRNIMNYGTGTIREYGLLYDMGDNITFGMGPPRPTGFESVAGNYGVHIPLMYRYQRFANFYSTGDLPGGVNLIDDNSLAPWTFASTENMLYAGQLSATKAGATGLVLDVGDLTIAGLPYYNIGDPIGLNAVVNGLGITSGPDGINTTYQLRTFAFSPIRFSKILNDKITRRYNITQSDDRVGTNVGYGGAGQSTFFGLKYKKAGDEIPRIPAASKVNLFSPKKEPNMGYNVGHFHQCLIPQSNDVVSGEYG